MPASTPTIDSSSTRQTRLQATFQAIKNMSAGPSSPRFNYSPGKQKESGERSPGYSEVTTEE